MEELDRIEERTLETERLEQATGEFLINKDKEETSMTLQFAKAILALDLEIKDLKEDQKEIKKEAKDNGVAVQKVNKALAVLKAIAKSNDLDLLEIETIEEVLGNDVDVKTMVSELVRKP